MHREVGDGWRYIGLVEEARTASVRFAAMRAGGGRADTESASRSGWEAAEVASVCHLLSPRRPAADNRLRWRRRC